MSHTVTAEGRRVLLVGCGELGSRHLQAVVKLPQVREVEVVDPRSAALARGRERVAEISDRQRSITIRWLASLEKATPGGDLCIIATHAQGRCQLVRAVVEGLGYSTFLLEKIIAPSIRELEDLIKYARGRGITAWVNCKARAYPFHRKVKQQLDPDDPILFNVVGGNHGLANNGVHAADLFAFYDGASQIESGGSCVDPVLHSSRRGPSLFDLSGTLHGYTAKGSHFTVSYARDHATGEQISITTRRYRCVVDALQRWAVESDAASGWAWRKAPFEGNLLVSEMTAEFAAAIFTGRCPLPTLEESAVAHRFILGELQPHFNRLLHRQLDLCPVT